MRTIRFWQRNPEGSSRPILSPDEISVSGERYHRESIEQLILTHAAGKLHWKTSAHLDRDLENKQDKFAVQVLVEGQRVGYIHRDHCKKVWNVIGSQGTNLECSIRWNGEPSNGVYAVKLFPSLW
jgi:hypothetical protein